MNRATACLHGYTCDTYGTGSLSVPIFQTATYAHASTDNPSANVYSRVKNPTRTAVEQTVATLEGARHGFGFASGMAAIHTVLALVPAGAHIVATQDLFGGSIRLFTQIHSPYTFDFVDTSHVASFAAAIKPETKAVFIETPSNPLALVTDIAAIKAAIVATGQDILLIVDNTFLSPYIQNPIELGADIALHSGTKYLGGHSDALAGFAVTDCDQLAERLNFLHVSMGATLAPQEAFLIHRGIKTLALRMERSQDNALAIAQWLSTHPRIRAVHYTGLPNHPGHATMQKQARGFGAMMSFVTDCAQTALDVVNHTQIITYAESLGCVNSLVTLPVRITHADVPVHEREARGITDCLVRFSVGIEHVDDLIADLDQALNFTRGENHA